MAHSKQRSKSIIEEIALDRIERLFELAKAEFPKNPQYSHAWIQLAFAIATRNRVRIPEKYKQSYCKKCHSLLVEGKTKATILKNGLAEITCKQCHAKFKRKKSDLHEP